MDKRQIEEKRVRARALSLLLTILIGYVVVLVLVGVFERRLIFFPDYPSRLDGDWHPRGLPVEDVWLTTADGVRLHAWWIPNEKARFTFLAFHGNASNIANRLEIYKFLRDAPGNVLALEYRGYGKSEGAPSESGIYLDAQAAYDYVVKEKTIEPTRIISFGQSLGTAVATHLAVKRPIAALILEAPFPSGSRVARKVFWFLPGADLIVYGQFNTGQWIKIVKRPVMIVHCEQDPVIPFAFGKEVYAAANEPKSFVAIPQACHEEASVMATARYRASLEKFLENVK